MRNGPCGAGVVPLTIVPGAPVPAPQVPSGIMPFDTARLAKRGDRSLA